MVESLSPVREPSKKFRIYLFARGRCREIRRKLAHPRPRNSSNFWGCGTEKRFGQNLVETGLLIAGPHVRTPRRLHGESPFREPTSREISARIKLGSKMATLVRAGVDPRCLLQPPLHRYYEGGRRRPQFDGIPTSVVGTGRCVSLARRSKK